MLWTCGPRPAHGQSFPRDVLSPPGQKLLVLKQNWSESEARWFYSAAQGSHLLPYQWFLHLEQPDAQELFRSENHMRGLGYLPRRPGQGENQDGLPVGFTRDAGPKEVYVGLTCAACHTGLVTYKDKAWLIDGAPTLGNVEQFQRRLVEALDATLKRDDKRARFLQALKRAGVATDDNQLKAELQKWLEVRRAYNVRNLPGPHATPFGPGRVDAFGAILNQVTSVVANVPANVHPANAPVSYPFLWDTPQHDRVQWNGAAKNQVVPLLKPLFGTEHVGALGRNTGEVLGVFGSADADTREFLIPQGYESTVKTDNLIKIEETVRSLWSPQWPAEFGPLDETLKAQGRALFVAHCLECHADIKRDDPKRHVVASMSAVGTDPGMASNFATRTASSGLLGGRFVKIPGVKRFPRRDPAAVGSFLVHTVQRVLLDAVPDRPFASGTLTLFQGYDFDYAVPAEIEVDGRTLTGTFQSLELLDGKLLGGSIQLTDGGTDLKILHGLKSIQLNRATALENLKLLHEKAKELAVDKLVQSELEISDSGRITLHLTPLKKATVKFQYKGRPLNGIWATAPYLHNGSVPNLDELLKPAAQRVPKFRVGSHEFDPTRVGYRSDLGTFEYDTTLLGNSNAGHEYGAKVFTADERKQLVEYMKSL